MYYSLNREAICSYRTAVEALWKHVNACRACGAPDTGGVFEKHDVAAGMRAAIFLEPQDVAGRHLPLGHGIDARHAKQQLRGLQPIEIVVQSRAADLAILRQPCLRRKAAEVGVEAVAEVPEHDRGRWLQPALFDGP